MSTDADPLALRLLYSPHDPHPPQHAFLLLDELEVLEAFYGGAGGGGKALALDTPIPTPDGWTTMGAVRPGDEILDETGHPCTVIAATEVMRGHVCYRVTMTDGASLVADAEHLWPASTEGERGNAAKRTPEARARRRTTRLPRGTGKRPDLAARNTATAAAATLAPPERPAPRTTEQLAAHAGRSKIALPAAAPLRLPRARGLLVDPYVLGLWLADGASASGRITIGRADEDATVALLEATGEEVTRVGAVSLDWRIEGLTTRLRALGILGAKRIPSEYLRASLGQRLALLQGIVDGDGHVTERGAVEITLTSRELMGDLVELLHTLGIHTRLRQSRANIDGRDCGPRWRVKFTTDLPAARMPRKRARLRARQRPARRYIAAVEPVESVPVRCIQVDAPSRLFLAGRGMVVTHNSDAMLMSALRYVDVPGYAALILRKTFADLELPGAIMHRAREWLAGTDAKWNDKNHRFTFPSGASLSFGYLETRNDRYRYAGAEFQFIAFDELTQFDQLDYTFLFSRLRRPTLTDKDGNPLPLPERVRLQREALSRIPLRMRSASNPGGRGHEWVKRRLVQRLPAELVEGEEPDPMDTSERAARRVFIPAKLRDNPSVDADSYEESLNALDPYTRAQILDGDWDARPPGDWVYDHHHLAAVYALGAELDEELRRGTIAPPAGELLTIGIDWGEHSHALIGWPLEGGGLYVVAESVNLNGEPGTTTAKLVGRRARRRGDEEDPEDDGPVTGVLDVVYALASAPRPANLPSPLPADVDPLTLVSDHRYDAAGIQSMRTYIKAVRRRHPRARSTSVPFGAPAPQSGKRVARRSYKAETIGHLRRLARRAGEGKTTGILAVGHRAPELRRQLGLLEWQDREAGIVRKGDDHGPDALIALDAPNAVRHR